MRTASRVRDRFLTGICSLLLFSTCSQAKGELFSDIPFDHWAYEAVNCLGKWTFIEGYVDGTFRGKQRMARWEMVYALDRVGEVIKRNTGKEPPSPPPFEAFADVAQNHWAVSSVRELARAGILVGFPAFVDLPRGRVRAEGCEEKLSRLADDGIIARRERFHPKQPTTRRETLEWLARSLGYELRRELVNNAENWAFRNMENREFALRDVIVGYPEGNLRFDQPVTRYEFAALIQKMINCFYPEMKCP